MNPTLNKALLAAAFHFFAATHGAAEAPCLDFRVEKNPGSVGAFSPLYDISGAGVNLKVYNDSFPNDPFAKYDIKGSLFGRRLEDGNSITNENFGGTSGVVIDAEGIYARFSKQTGWPELRIETRLAPDADTRAVVLFSVLANYLPKIPGASSFEDDHQPTQSFSLRQFGDTTLVQGPGLLNVRVDRDFFGQNYRYTVRGRGFGKDFDGADELKFERDGVFLGTGGARIRGCGMDLEIKIDDFGGRRIIVRGAAGDSNPLAAFAMAFVRYLNGVD